MVAEKFLDRPPLSIMWQVLSQRKREALFLVLVAARRPRARGTSTCLRDQAYARTERTAWTNALSWKQNNEEGGGLGSILPLFWVHEAPLSSLEMQIGF
jgi:hypothetical protein